MINSGIQMKWLSYIFSKILILLIRGYQLIISPALGPHCRHVPTCSHYTIEAVKEWGFLKGFWLGLKRVARCHPWGTHGYDPVPRRGKGIDNENQYSTIEVKAIDTSKF